VKQAGGEIFHYGWVRQPEIMKEKMRNFHQLWHDDNWIKEQQKAIQEFDYNQIDAIVPFNGKHPDCMKERIQEKNWNYLPNLANRKISTKNKLLYWFEHKTGIRIGEYKNYLLID
jgi:hypothetical protein